MTLAETPQAHDVAARADTEDGGRADASAKPALNPELVRRFQALVEEVTEELVQAGNGDRAVCRADAIQLLMATNEALGEPAESVESPLSYLLLQEQQTAAALLGPRHAQPAPAPLTYMKV